MKFFSMAVCFVAMATMIGCAKDNELANNDKVVISTVTVGLESADASKLLDNSGANLTRVFSVGEKIAVVYENQSSELVKAEVTLAAGDITNAGKTATITVAMTNPKTNGTVKLIYPASMANNDGTVNWDALYNNQNGTLGTLSSHFDFSIFEGTLDGTILPADPVMASQVAICKFTVKDAGTPFTSSVTKLTVMNGSDFYSVTPNTSLDAIWVAVKPVTSGDIKLYVARGKALYTKTVTGKTLAANTPYAIGLTPTLVPGAVSGLFRVNNTGKLVYFSQGNLRYESGAWSFFPNQYDHYSTYSADAWDKFGWSTAATTYGMNTSQNEDDYSGNFVDWGTNAISNGGNTSNSGWCTLTGQSSGEWDYLFVYRKSGSTVNGTTNARYTHATINTDGTGVNGIILFPDGVTIANSEATTWGTINGTSSWGTRCTTAQWAALEAKGCVFLPAAGVRNGSAVNNASTKGYYWSSSPFFTGSNYAHFLYFTSGVLTTWGNSTRDEGCSVRLVRQVE